MADPRNPQMFKARLREWDPDVVLSTASQVRALMAQPGWLKLQELIGQVADRHLTELTIGRTLEHADYARLLGVIGGLRSLGVAADAVFETARDIETRRESRADAPAERTG